MRPSHCIQALWGSPERNFATFAPPFGTIAQVVEQWIENPCVPGSNPGGTTLPKQADSGPLVSFLTFSP